MFLVPLLGAVIGYVTNYIAILLLFRPHRAIYLFKWRLPFTPGLIPKERLNLSKKIGQTLADNVLTHDVLGTAFMSDALLAQLSDKAYAAMLNFLDNDDLVVDYAAGLLKVEPHEVGAFVQGRFAALMEGEELRALVIDMVDKHRDKLAPMVKGVLQKPEVDKSLRAMLSSILKENFGGVVGMFLNNDKIYNSIVDNLLKYLENSDKIDLLPILDKLTPFVTAKVAPRMVEPLLNTKVKALSPHVSRHEERIKAAISGVISQLAERASRFIAERIDIADLAESRINQFETEEVERLILDVTKSQLRMITYLGGVLGFLIGLVSLIP